MKLLMLVIFFFNSHAENFNIVQGEELKYDVRYSVLFLGHLKFKAERIFTTDQENVIECHLWIDSNPSLPFVDIHDHYISYIDQDECYSRGFIAYELKGNDTLYTRYYFDYDSSTIRIVIKKFTPEKRISVLDSMVFFPDTLKRIYDSLSLLYYARKNTGIGKQEKLQVFAYNEFGETMIMFDEGYRKFSLKNATYNKGFYLDGKLKLVGIAGIKDDFEGWFSIDEQRVPLKAHMKAFIGNVSIKLKSWKNWRSSHIYFK